MSQVMLGSYFIYTSIIYHSTQICLSFYRFYFNLATVILCLFLRVSPFMATNLLLPLPRTEIKSPAYNKNLGSTTSLKFTLTCFFFIYADASFLDILYISLKTVSNRNELTVVSVSIQSISFSNNLAIGSSVKLIFAFLIVVKFIET